jgi:acetylornithine deacetylase/succinyl-diaminopimelate desuccinylase-like protein
MTSDGEPARAEHEAVRFAADLIAIDTTNRSGGDGNERPAAEYAAKVLAEAGLEPCVLESAPGRANVVARMAGTGSSAGALLLHGHLDVVPAVADAWSVHPFGGEIRDGQLWGRGAVDMKSADAAILAVIAEWGRTGRRPARDVVIALTADEEDTAAYGAKWLVDRHAELLRDCTEAVGESGGFTFHAGPGLRLYPIASAERGSAWLRLTARGTAGHGSQPNGDNAVSMLVQTLARIAEHRWPVRLIPTVAAAVDAISAAVGRAGPDGLDVPEIPDRHDWLGWVDRLDQLGPARSLVAGVIRNSATPTMLRAGDKVNVIPGEAVGYVDGRVLAGHEAEFTATLDELTGPGVTWGYLHSSPPVEAPLDTPLLAAMSAAVVAEDPAGIPVPYCMSGGTDAKEFARLGMNCYGFTPLVLPGGYDYHAMFHAVDERVPLTAVHSAVRILDRFLASQ